MQRVKKVTKSKKPKDTEALKTEVWTHMPDILVKKFKDKMEIEADLDRVLKSIALGEHLVKRPVINFNKITGKLDVTIVDELPSHSDMVQAIDILFKRYGSYTDTKNSF